MPIPPRLRTMRALREQLDFANQVFSPGHQTPPPAFRTFSTAYQDLARLFVSINAADTGCTLPPVEEVRYGDELARLIPSIHMAIIGGCQGTIEIFGTPALLYGNNITIYGNP